MTFEKYQHVERYGTDEVIGIEDGECFVFPKLDGTNASVWWDGEVKAGSRRRPLEIGDDNHGFCAAILQHDGIRRCLENNPTLRLYGEWLVPHTLKTYRQDAWRKFYVFDVMDDKGYLHYDLYRLIMESFYIDYVPCIARVVNGNEETFRKIAEKNDYLMQPGEIGEGIVIKRYGYTNRFGRVTWAKLVRSEFKEQHVKAMGPPVVQGVNTVERVIADTVVTKTLVDKERAKIDTTPVQPRLLSTVYHCILTEELADMVKKLKNPTIDFKVLNRLVIEKVKEHARDLF